MTGMNSRLHAPLTRRIFISDVGLGFTALALGAILHRDGYAKDREWAAPTGQPHFPPKAKSVIWIFRNGVVSQMETFDPKPCSAGTRARRSPKRLLPTLRIRRSSPSSAW